MRVVSRRGGILIWGLLASLTAGVGLARLASRANLERAYQAEPSPPSPDCALSPGWRVIPMRELPEEVATLNAAREGDNQDNDYILAGTTGEGMVVRFPATTSRGMLTMASGMGDELVHGICAVNRLRTLDIDGDGQIETFATTSQIMPRGRPRLYAWSARKLEGVAAPEIDSSWSHGLAVVPGETGAPSRLFVTYCGHGEVVEFQARRGESEGGFLSRGPLWKQVGALPYSGEQIEAVDADNDGRLDLVASSGFALNQASVRLYAPGARPGDPLVPGVVLDEGGRFGNVRFLVGDLSGNGANELVAWWCTDLAGGDCEVVRYQLNAEGRARREVIARGRASQLWPDDNQAALADLDGDGKTELWFATHAGALWRYDPAGGSSPSRVGMFPKGLGPVATLAAKALAPRDSLLLGQGRVVFRLERSEP